MRDPDRLDNFYFQLREIHKTQFPDWRFGQLMSNFLEWVFSEKKRDPFFPEENEMLKYFKEFANGTSPYFREND